MAIAKLGYYSLSVKCIFVFLRWHSDFDLLWKTNKNQIKPPLPQKLGYDRASASSLITYELWKYQKLGITLVALM